MKVAPLLLLSAGHVTADTACWLPGVAFYFTFPSNFTHAPIETAPCYEMGYRADVFAMGDAEQQDRVAACVAEQALGAGTLDAVLRQPDGVVYKLDASMGNVHKARCATSMPGFMTFVAASAEGCKARAEAVVEQFCGTTTGAPQIMNAYGSNLVYGIGDTVASLSTAGAPLGAVQQFEVGSGLVTPNARMRAALTDPVVSDKRFRENTWVHPSNETGTSYSLLDLFGTADFLVVDVGANWCGTCLLSQRSVRQTGYAPPVPTLYPAMRTDKVRFVQSVDHLITNNAQSSSDPTKAHALWYDGHPEHHLVIREYDYLHPKCGVYDAYVSAGSVGAGVAALFNPSYGAPATASAYVDGPAFPDVLHDVFGIWPWATSTAVFRKTATHVEFVYQTYTAALSTDFLAERIANPYDTAHSVAALAGGQSASKDMSLLVSHPRHATLRTLLGQSVSVAMPVPQAPYASSSDACGAIRDVRCGCTEYGRDFKPRWLYTEEYGCCTR